MKPNAMLFALFAIMSPALAGAQEPLEPGTRVRVAMNQGQPMVATLSALGPDSIQLALSGGVTRALPRSNVVTLERSLGRKTQFWKHLGLAVGISTLAGGLIGAATWEKCEPVVFMDCFLEPESAGEAMVLGGLVGAVIGTPLGIIVGASVKTERWQRISLE